MAETAILLIWIAAGLLSLQIIRIFTIVIDLQLSDFWFFFVIKSINFAAPIIAFVAFLVWFSRACYNLRQRVSNFRYSETYAVGSWFIPIANLWKPYMVMNELFVETNKLLKKNNIPEQANFNKKLLDRWWLSCAVANGAIFIIIICLLTAMIHSYILNCPCPNFAEALVYIEQFLTVVTILCVIIWAVFAVKIIRNYSEIEPFLYQIEDEKKNV